MKRKKPTPKTAQNNSVPSEMMTLTSQFESLRERLRQMADEEAELDVRKAVAGQEAKLANDSFAKVGTEVAEAKDFLFKKRRIVETQIQVTRELLQKHVGGLATPASISSTDIFLSNAMRGWWGSSIK